MRGTMMDTPLSVTRLLEHGRSVHGSAMIRFGHAASALMSRTDWCEWPGPPGRSPASDAT